MFSLNVSSYSHDTLLQDTGRLHITKKTKNRTQILDVMDVNLNNIILIVRTV